MQSGNTFALGHTYGSMMTSIPLIQQAAEVVDPLDSPTTRQRGGGDGENYWARICQAGSQEVEQREEGERAKERLK
jgi:hypothetical protein